MNFVKTIFKFLLLTTVSSISVFGQFDDEPILYYQMEPLDDTLFVLIQEDHESRI